jgi:DNA-binding response OmpR family regulator
MLTGFSVGGDDYISKPFSIKEVTARVKAVIKRINQAVKDENVPDELVFNNLTIDIKAKELVIEGKRITLTKTEFEILVLLAKNPERIFSRENILDYVWKDAPYITERTVDVHITRIRKKMGDYANMVINRPGYGYKFNG